MRTVYTKNEITILGDICSMKLYNRKCEVIAETIFDCNKANLVNKYKWCLSNQGYVITSINKKIIGIHRVIMKTKKGFVVDHINFNKLDNRCSNLRNLRHCNNCLNNRAKGVSKVANCSTWRAYISRNGKQIHLGCFTSYEDALKRREDEIKKYLNA